MQTVKQTGADRVKEHRLQQTQSSGCIERARRGSVEQLTRGSALCHDDCRRSLGVAGAQQRTDHPQHHRAAAESHSTARLALVTSQQLAIVMVQRRDQYCKSIHNK